jgi:folate-binding protein YgfZ
MKRFCFHGVTAALPLVLASWGCLRAHAFLIQLHTSVSAARHLLSSFDDDCFESYPDARPEVVPSKLSSAYPEGTPPGLRGEAVRSALRTGRCIGWHLGSDAYLSHGGILQIRGAGTRDFVNNKFTQEFPLNSETTYQEACLLDAKGRAIDRLKISLMDDDTALILTSPGHSSKDLLKNLDPFVFPLDRITLADIEAFTFSIASVQWKDIEIAFQAVPKIKKNPESFPLPRRADQCRIWNWDESGTKVLVIPSVGMPSQVCVGFSFVFFGAGTMATNAGSQVWQFLIGDSNAEGPIGIGASEYESLRIEAGVPAFGLEMGNSVKVSPLELHMQDNINMNKGCYLGQEGVASIVKNPRGPPRTLYSVVFDDDFNTYKTQTQVDSSDLENLTRMPRPGDSLFALGSNEELSVGTITSVAEAGSTGERCVVALALVRRADSIMKQMKQLDLEIERSTEDFMDPETDNDGIIMPPPLDPLEGLEIIIGGSFTTGKLKMVPSRALRKGQNLFLLEERVAVDDYFDEVPTERNNGVLDGNMESVDLAVQEADAAKAAEAATAEAQRKAEKLEMLKKRAEEAMARRKKQ